MYLAPGKSHPFFNIRFYYSEVFADKLPSLKKIYSPIMTLIFFIITNQVVAGESESASQGVGKAAHELTVLLGNMNTATANFTQTVTDARGNILQYSSGVMKIKRPLRFVWNTIDPYEQLIVSNGESMWVYDKDLEQVTIQALNKQAGDTPTLLFSGDPELLHQHFDVREGSVNLLMNDLDAHKSKNNNKYNNSNIKVFDLYPKDPDAAFSMMSISFGNKKLIAMDLKDHLGQRTDITFDKIKLNPKLKDQLFVFEPPKGVDVIYNTSPDQ